MTISISDMMDGCCARKNSYELYGADFMLTSDLRPWLLEINSSPALGATTSITSRLCSAVLEDVIKVKKKHFFIRTLLLSISGKISIHDTHYYSFLGYFHSPGVHITKIKYSRSKIKRVRYTQEMTAINTLSLGYG